MGLQAALEPALLCLRIRAQSHSRHPRVHVCRCYMRACADPFITSSGFAVRVMSSTPAIRICLGANPPRTDKSVTGYRDYPHGFVCPGPLHRFTVRAYTKACSNAPTAASKRTFLYAFKIRRCPLSCPLLSLSGMLIFTCHSRFFCFFFRRMK